MEERGTEDYPGIKTIFRRKGRGGEEGTSRKRLRVGWLPYLSEVKLLQASLLILFIVVGY